MLSAENLFRDYQRLSEALGVSDYSARIIHYTSMRNLERILETGELWFGCLVDMNDTSECQHFIRALQTRMPASLESRLPLLPTILATLGSSVRGNTFASSWCEYHDDQPDGRLSMWRLYAEDAAGVGIVVDSSQFQPSSITAENLNFNVHTSNITYLKEDEVIGHAVESLDAIDRANLDFQPQAHSLAAAMMLLSKATCVKHQGYSEEQEIRFLHSGWIPGISGPSNMRRSAETGRTYFGLPLLDFPSANFDLRPASILKRIVIGPKSGREERAETVRQLLNAHNLAGVEVIVSDIPYR